MANTKKKKQNSKEIIYPLVLILLVVAAVILIVFMTQNAREAAALKTEQPDAPKIVVTPHLVGDKQYSSVPPMLIDTSKKYTATVTMEKGGSFEIELFADKAPITVNSFVFLAREGYFDGVTFHRVLEGFVAQGGDPTGTGRGNPGYQFEYEDSGYKFDKAGWVAMANSAPRSPTNGSQFFITYSALPSLDGGYTIFGLVTDGMDIVDGLTRRDPEKSPDFQGDVIQSITITEE